MLPFVPKYERGGVLAGRYKVERMLGTGGMSRVYLASDLKLPGKYWAVKETPILAENGMMPEEEASILVSLNHHRLPRISDYFHLREDGCSYLVMDYVEGIHLDLYAQRMGKRMRAADLAGFGLQICEGLHYLHTRTPPIIHRDIKPSNLLIDERGEIRIVDLGIARKFNPQRAEDTLKLGTIGFAAPEQYGGSQSDARADLYSLGAVLLYLATGSKFHAWTDEAQGELRAKGFEMLEPVICRLLQSDKEKRFQSARQAGESLGQCIAIQRESETRKMTDGHRIRPREERVARTTVIAVMGSTPGAGTTHTSILLAHTLTRQSRSVAIVDMEPRSTAFECLGRFIEGDDSSPRSKEPRNFRFRGVEYIRAPSRPELLRLLSEGYEYVVCDLGTGGRKELIEEFQRADLSVLVSPAAAWRMSHLQAISEQADTKRRNWVCCVPLASFSTVRRLRKWFGTGKIYALPWEPEPFEPGIETIKSLSELCLGKIPAPENQSKVGLWRNRKR